MYLKSCHLQHTFSVPTYFVSFTGPGNSLGKCQPLTSSCIAFLGFLLNTESAWNANPFRELTKVEDISVKKLTGLRLSSS